MKSAVKFCLLLFTGILLSCGSGHKSDVSPYDELMSLHDQTMQKMDEMYRLKQQLSEALKNVTDTTSADRALLINKLNELNNANKGMMMWMHEFKPKPDSLDEQGLDKYYKDQLEKMKSVRDHMDKAMADARKTLNH